MANTPDLPEGIDLSEGIDEHYENSGVRDALRALLETPDYVHLAEFLNSLRNGYLVVDVTGAQSKKKGARVRTIRSTQGQLVLPIFTSLAELRALTPAAGGDAAQGALMPARAALSLITSDRFVAVEFDKATVGQVILRKFVTLVLSDDEITAELLESQQ